MIQKATMRVYHTGPRHRLSFGASPMASEADFLAPLGFIARRSRSAAYPMLENQAGVRSTPSGSGDMRSAASISARAESSRATSSPSSLAAAIVCVI